MDKDDIYIALGKLAVNYTSLEFFLVPIFNSLKNTNKGGLTFMKDKGVKKTTEKIKNYAQEKINDQELLNTLTLLMDNVNDVRKKRNNLLHSIFFQNSKTDQTIQIDLLATKELNQNVTRPVTPNDIDQVSKEARNLKSKLIITILNLNKELKNNGTIQ